MKEIFAVENQNLLACPHLANSVLGKIDNQANVLHPSSGADPSVQVGSTGGSAKAFSNKGSAPQSSFAIFRETRDCPQEADSYASDEGNCVVVRSDACDELHDGMHFVSNNMPRMYSKPHCVQPSDFQERGSPKILFLDLPEGYWHKITGLDKAMPLTTLYLRPVC